MKLLGLMLASLAIATILAPTASAAPDTGVATGGIVKDVQGCVYVTLYGGTYMGDYLSCRGVGIVPQNVRWLVEDVQGCAHVAIYGGTYWGHYMACMGP